MTLDEAPLLKFIEQLELLDPTPIDAVDAVLIDLPHTKVKLQSFITTLKKKKKKVLTPTHPPTRITIW